MLGRVPKGQHSIGCAVCAANEIFLNTCNKFSKLNSWVLCTQIGGFLWTENSHVNNNFLEVANWPGQGGMCYGGSSWQSQKNHTPLSASSVAAMGNCALLRHVFSHRWSLAEAVSNPMCHVMPCLLPITMASDHFTSYIYMWQDCVYFSCTGFPDIFTLSLGILFVAEWFFISPDTAAPLQLV